MNDDVEEVDFNEYDSEKVVSKKKNYELETHLHGFDTEVKYNNKTKYFIIAYDEKDKNAFEEIKNIYNKKILKLKKINLCNISETVSIAEAKYSYFIIVNLLKRSFKAVFKNYGKYDEENKVLKLETKAK